MRRNAFAQNTQNVIDATNISMTDNIFSVSLPKKNEREFLDTVKKCPLCGANNFKDFRDHAQEGHPKTKSSTVEKYIGHQIDLMREYFATIRALHFILQIQGRRFRPTQEEKDSYVNLMSELRTLCEDSFNNKDK